VKITRDLTLAILVFMLVVPSVVLLGSNPNAPDFTMMLMIAGGAVGVIVLIAGIFVFKRR